MDGSVSGPFAIKTRLKLEPAPGPYIQLTAKCHRSP